MKLGNSGICKEEALALQRNLLGNTSEVNSE
jgi:hypothetical protein